MVDGSGVALRELKMKILITGGAGFDRQPLGRQIDRRETRSRVMTRLSTGRYSNIGAALEEGLTFRLIIDTVLNTELMERAYS